jgi:hypothetical protein
MALGLEQRSVWKANELRLAKAREQLLLSQLEVAEETAEDAHAQVLQRLALWAQHVCAAELTVPIAQLFP